MAEEIMDAAGAGQPGRWSGYCTEEGSKKSLRKGGAGYFDCNLTATHRISPCFSPFSHDFSKNGIISEKRKTPANTGFARILAGADNQIRTGDLVLTKDVLCLLSHISVGCPSRQLLYYSKLSPACQEVFSKNDLFRQNLPFRQLKK